MDIFLLAGEDAAAAASCSDSDEAVCDVEFAQWAVQ